MVPLFLLSDIHKMTGYGRRCCHGWTHQMCAATSALTAFEVAVAGGGAAFAFGELVAVHGDAHAAAGFAPFKAGLAEDVGHALFFGHAADTHGAGDDHSSDIGGDVLAFDILGSHTQVFEA